MSELVPVLDVGFALVLIEYLVFSIYWYTRRPLAGSAVLLLLLICEAVWIDLPSVSAFITIHIEDVVILPIFLAGVYRHFTTGRVRTSGLALSVILTVFLFALVRGTHEFGLIRAGNDARAMFYFLAPTLYFSSFQAIDHVRLVRQWLATCTALAALTVFRWLATALVLPIPRPWEDFASVSVGPNFRVLQAAFAMTLAVGMLLSLQLKLSHAGRAWERNLVFVLIPILLVLQHRTVWMVSITGLVWLIFRDRAHRRQLLMWLAAMLGVGLTLFILLGTRTNSQLISALGNASSNTNTLEWRIEGWQRLLAGEREQDIVNRIWGQPFGMGFERLVRGVLVDFSPHNFYVQTLLQLGIVGLVLLIMLYFSGITRIPLSGLSPSERLDFSALWVVALVAQLVYFIAYSPTYDQGIVLGAVLGKPGQILAVSGAAIRLVSLGGGTSRDINRGTGNVTQ